MSSAPWTDLQTGQHQRYHLFLQGIIQTMYVNGVYVTMTSTPARQVFAEVTRPQPQECGKMVDMRKGH